MTPSRVSGPDLFDILLDAADQKSSVIPYTAHHKVTDRGRSKLQVHHGAVLGQPRIDVEIDGDVLGQQEGINPGHLGVG